MVKLVYNTNLNQRYKSRTSNTASKCTKSIIVLGIVKGHPICLQSQSNVIDSFLLYCLAYYSKQNNYIININIIQTHIITSIFIKKTIIDIQ